MTTSTDSSTDLLKLLNSILEKKSYSEIAATLNVAIGTVKRWNELEKVPRAYYFELMKIANVNIDYLK